MRVLDLLLDDLLQPDGTPGKTRRALLGGLALLATVPNARALAANRKRRKRRRRRRRKKRCKVPNQCGSSCCGPDSCFAGSVDATNGEPLTFACCPAEKVCRSTHPNYKDQCCYPDETCQPSLADNPLTQTICCRPCAGGVGGCCLNLNEECIDGVCTPVDTARLARTRRPG
jgi:hypothetical protein